MEEQLKSKSMKLACSEHISKNSHEFIGRMVYMDISIFVTKFLFTLFPHTLMMGFSKFF